MHDSSPVWVANLSPCETPIRKQSDKENNHEAGRTKKFPEAQESKETPCHEEVHSGEKSKRVIAAQI